jgi:fatty acid-binding protein DegV
MDDFLNLFQSVPEETNEYLILSTSSCLPSIYNNALQSAEYLRRQLSIQVVDTLTVHAGLLHILHEASRLSASGLGLDKIVLRVRELVPHVYCLLCTPNLSYLSNLCIIDPAQAAIGDLFEWMPVYSLDTGRFLFMDKFQNSRQVNDYFINFLSEFPSINQVMIIQNAFRDSPETHLLTDHIHFKHPRSHIIRLPLSIPFTAMFGPDVFGMIVIENITKRWSRYARTGHN